MNKSDQINELAAALSDFQGAVVDVHKGKAGHGYSYADLASVLTLSRPLLKQHGLSVSQLLSNDNDTIAVETVLMHQSGQWIGSTASMPIDRKTTKEGRPINSFAQDAGSVVTYLRRYSLTAILGIAQTDDDASLYVVANTGEAARDEALRRYEAQNLPILEAAAANGLQALQEAFKGLDKSPMKAGLWAAHGDNLKAMASKEAA